MCDAPKEMACTFCHKHAKAKSKTSTLSNMLLLYVWWNIAKYSLKAGRNERKCVISVPLLAPSRITIWKNDLAFLIQMMCNIIFYSYWCLKIITLDGNDELKRPDAWNLVVNKTTGLQCGAEQLWHDESDVVKQAMLTWWQLSIQNRAWEANATAWLSRDIFNRNI